MKTIFLIPLLLMLIASPVFAQISDKTGLLTRLDVDTSGHNFEVVTVSNFEILDHEFDKEEKRLTIFAKSGLENNLGELTIPKNLLSGNLTFYLNEQEVTQKFKSNNLISFVTLNFTGVGNNKIDIIATEALVGIKDIEKEIPERIDSAVEETGGGCLIATATYGSELAPQVQKLREIRDSKLLSTESGSAFITGFNYFYYSFSPGIADYERENPYFKDIVKTGITPMLTTLSLMDYAESETEVLGIGIGVILLNFGMYVGVPAIGIIVIRRL